MDINISPETHFLVVSTEGNPVLENNRVLLQTITDGSLVYVPLTPQIVELFGLAAATIETVENHDLENENNADCSDINNNEDVLEGKFYWDHKNTLLMLEEYRKRMPKFRNPKFKKKLLWNQIADIMKQNGYLVSSDAVDKKMRNMKNTFRTIVDNNNKKKTTGRGRMHWPYFTIFEDMFKEDKTINIACVMSSTRSPTENTVLPEINTISQLVQTSSPQSVEYDSTSPSTSSASLAGATPKRTAKLRQLDRWRKRQLDIEEEKLLELKRVREAIEKGNEIQERKTNILDTLVKKI